MNEWINLRIWERRVEGDVAKTYTERVYRKFQRSEENILIIKKKKYKMEL